MTYKYIDTDGKKYTGKKASAEWISRDCPELKTLDGYGVFSCGLFQDYPAMFGNSLDMEELQEVYNFVIDSHKALGLV